MNAARFAATVSSKIPPGIGIWCKCDPEDLLLNECLLISLPYGMSSSLRFNQPITALAICTYIQRMVAPATTATAVVWLNSESAFAREAEKPKVDLKKVRESVMEIIDKDEGLRGDGTSLRGTFIRYVMSVPYCTFILVLSTAQHSLL